MSLQTLEPPPFTRNTPEPEGDRPGPAWPVGLAVFLFGVVAGLFFAATLR